MAIRDETTRAGVGEHRAALRLVKPAEARRQDAAQMVDASRVAGSLSCILDAVRRFEPTSGNPLATKAESMSRRNGDRARFQKERKRKMLRRQRVQAFIKAGAPESPQSPDAPKAAAKA